MNMNMTQYTVTELNELINMATTEMRKRQEKQRVELIENFRKAYNALQDNNINISYNSEDVLGVFYLRHWERFYFE